MAQTPAQLLAAAQEQLAKTKERLAIAEAKATADKKAASADRAAAVTAERLATSPIAKEAARTTAALKSFTAKGGILGVPGSNLEGSTDSAFTSKDGILYGNGKPFTGINNGTNYFNGKPLSITDLEGTGTEDDPFTLNGQEFTGMLGGRSFQKGRLLSGNLKTGDGNGLKTEAQIAADTYAASQKSERKSAYDLLLSEFKQYGLEALVTPLKSLIEEGVSPSEFTLRLRETDAYKKRFAANAQRVAKGLRALSEAEYIGTEDQYQDVMRRYGLPESYYTKGDLGIQSGFEKFIAGDVSAVEVEDRIQTAQNRVVNSNPEVSKALKEFYPGISNGDILAYVLDPTNAIEEIKRKVTAAEIGGAAIQSGLGYKGNTPEAMRARAEELRNAGITKAQAQSGFGTIAGGLERGSQLASIYGEDPYTQTTAEQEVFGLAGAQNASTQRKKIAGLEKATFGGQSGASTSALSRDRAGAY
jgi:hypothetical protein